jgi:hypothetical protein
MKTHDAHRQVRWRAALAGGVAACLATTIMQGSASAGPAAPVLGNGGFETGNLAGWATADKGNAGVWTADKGDRSPISGARIPRPPEGGWQAVADQVGPGSRILYRDIVIGAGPVELDLTLWYRNRATRFFTPRELKPLAVSKPNQQLRIDLIKPTARIRSMAGEDILANVFRTRRGDANRIAPTPVQKDLSAFEGQTVRLRIAEVDNQGNFQVGVDGVHLVDLPSGGQP